MRDCGVFLKFFPLTSLILITKARFLPSALITECGYHGDGGSKNSSNACALVSDHLSSTSWKQ